MHVLSCSSADSWRRLLPQVAERVHASPPARDASPPAALPQRKYAPLSKLQTASPAERLQIERAQVPSDSPSLSARAHRPAGGGVQRLMKEIDLKEESFDIFSLQPLSDYDLMLLNLGRGQCQHAAVQYSEDWVARETQVGPRSWMATPCAADALSIVCAIVHGAVDRFRATIQRRARWQRRRPRACTCAKRRTLGSPRR